MIFDIYITILNFVCTFQTLLEFFSLLIRRSLVRAQVEEQNTLKAPLGNKVLFTLHL